MGLIFDQNMKFDMHLDNVLNRCSRMYHNVLYNSLVRSIIAYGSTIWRPRKKEEIVKLKRIQKKILHHLAFIDANVLHRFCNDYSGLEKKFNLPTVESFQENIDGIIIMKEFSITKNSWRW